MSRAIFYTDAHIHYAAVKQLRDKGVDIVRCQDVGMDDASDSEHLTYATDQGRVVVTCDKDFLICIGNGLSCEKNILVSSTVENLISVRSV